MFIIISLDCLPILAVTCLHAEQICAYSCQPTEEARKKDVLLLLNGKDGDVNCNGFLNNTTAKVSVKEGLEDRRKLFLSSSIYVAILLFLTFATTFAVLTCASAAINYYNWSEHNLFRWALKCVIIVGL